MYGTVDQAKYILQLDQFLITILTHMKGTYKPSPEEARAAFDHMDFEQKIQSLERLDAMKKIAEKRLPELKAFLEDSRNRTDINPNFISALEEVIEGAEMVLAEKDTEFFQHE